MGKGARAEGPLTILPHAPSPKPSGIYVGARRAVPLGQTKEATHWIAPTFFNYLHHPVAPASSRCFFHRPQACAT